MGHEPYCPCSKVETHAPCTRDCNFCKCATEVLPPLTQADGAPTPMWVGSKEWFRQQEDAKMNEATRRLQAIDITAPTPDPVPPYKCPQCLAGDHSVHDKSVYRLGCQNNNCNCIFESSVPSQEELPPLDQLAIRVAISTRNFGEDESYADVKEQLRQRESQLLTAQRTIAKLEGERDEARLAVSLSCELHGCASESCTAAQYHQDAQDMIARVERAESSNATLLISHNLQVKTMDVQAKMIAELEAK